MPTNAEVIAQTLAEAGIRRAFGLPGGEVVALIDACRRVGVDFVLTGHEASAAFMADVTGQITRTAGVCISTLGPGATNLVTGVANAWLDRSPMLAISAQIAMDVYPHYSHQRLSLAELFVTITKAAVRVTGRGTRALVRHALELAAAPRPGPVHLTLSSDVAVREAEDLDGYPQLNAGRPHTDSRTALLEVIARLRRAERPLVIVGIGAPPESWMAIRAFAEQTEWPYMATPKAKGVLTERSPRFLGVTGGMALEEVTTETIMISDAILGIGLDPVECDKPWFLKVPVINVTEAPTAEGSYQPLEIVGDIVPILETLAGALERKHWPQALLQARRTLLRHSAEGGSGMLSPIAVIRALRDALPEHAICATDVGSHKLLFGQLWEVTEPGTFFVSNGLSAMGYGLPAAMAAAFHWPDRPVMAVVGDGGMLMMLHNLMTIADRRLPVLSVVLLDNSLSLIRFAEERRGIDPYGVDFHAPNFVALARGFGVRAERTESIQDLQAAVASYLACMEPTVLEVPIDMTDYRRMLWPRE